jgi:endonuclease/exonuclease/phosphatase family metal-dependent hydrolase
MKRVWRAVAIFVLVAATAAAAPFIVVVYNVENLFDADGKAGFEDYQSARYSRGHVLTKLQNISRLLARFENGRGPDVILFQEIEADQTPGATAPRYDEILRRYADVRIEEMLGAKFDDAVADLPAEALLAKAMADQGMTGYHVVAAENVTADGSTRALAQACVVFTRFPVKAVRSHPTLDARAVLEVQVEVEGAPLYLFNNHWKSGASDPATETVRIENARTLRRRLSEILRADPNADVIVGGDFNSHYNQNRRNRQMKETAVNDVLGSQGNELAVRGEQRDLYNLWFELPFEERASDAYRGEWGTLMQMMVTRGLYDYRGVQYVDNSFGVAKVAELNVDAKGLPLRWSFDGASGAGYSDHFPIYAKFLTVADHRTDRWVALRRASVETAEPAEAPKVDFSRIDLEAVAIRAEQVPADTSLRSDAFKGKIIRVDGKVGPSRRLSVSFLGEVYDVWSFDEALLKGLRERFEAGQPIRFYGELGQYKERWQFVIHDASWVK